MKTSKPCNRANGCTFQRWKTKWGGQCRAEEKLRQEFKAAESATLWFETNPGMQLQIDLGAKWTLVAGEHGTGIAPGNFGGSPKSSRDQVAEP